MILKVQNTKIYIKVLLVNSSFIRLYFVLSCTYNIFPPFIFTINLLVHQKGILKLLVKYLCSMLNFYSLQGIENNCELVLLNNNLSAVLNSHTFMKIY